MSTTITSTTTYTIVDIRKTFEGFSADFRMIATRTGKKSIGEVENYLNDIMAWAENKYLKYVDITLIDANSKPLKAARYSVDENGKAIQSERAGNNDWQNIANTKLMIIASMKDSWLKMPEEGRAKFKLENNFKISWGRSQIDNSYSHLSKEAAQLYASKGYELKKENFK
ncbi:MAG: hypothetical protein IPP32_08690 [Bacteroidetes bacterium]|nr:hypothetical protein [Bacteroidota bacterium]